MKTTVFPAASRPLLILLIVAPVVLVCGCTTTALWDEETLASHYRPAIPNNLHLFYSNERRDILAQYDERKNKDTKINSRFYWLEANVQQVNQNQRPRFASVKSMKGLIPIPVVSETNSPGGGTLELYAVAKQDGDAVTFYADEKELVSYQLPVYKSDSRRVYQILLTPFTVAVDATAAGAIGALQSSEFLSILGR